MKIGAIRYGNVCLLLLSPLLIDVLSFIVTDKPFISYWFKMYIAGRYYAGRTEYWMDPSLYGALSISIFLFFLILCKKKETLAPSLNLDPIPLTDKEWITEIKTRKQKREKFNAYSKNGSAAARRKAKMLGIEDCFVEFLSEREANKRRGW
ncbi:MAG: hypothetical protein HF962_03095 [Sulfurovum sp.]|nr:hypothetical protein [Sulfurovum sp.]